MNVTDNMSILKDKNKRLVRWSSLQGMSSRMEHSSPNTEFTNVRLSKQEFKQIMDIIEKELLVILPNKSTETGFIGYMVFDLDANVILEFGEKNIPDGFTVEKVFTQVCHSSQNKELLQQLANDGILAAELHETFTEYCN